MAAYSLALYMDFSAYSDFAIGVSRVMGIRVPENFNWPYLSTNIQDFWNRWHMSLSSWVRDYVFSTVGRQLFKTRLRHRPGVIATASYFATFLVVGAWHGLAIQLPRVGRVSRRARDAVPLLQSVASRLRRDEPLYQSRLGLRGRRRPHLRAGYDRIGVFPDGRAARRPGVAADAVHVRPPCGIDTDQ